MHAQSRAKGVLPWQHRAFITLQLASEISGISRTSLYRLATAGDIRLRRLSGRVLIPTEDLTKLIESAADWRCEVDHDARH